VSVGYAAFPHNIEHCGVFLEGPKATNLPRRSRSVRNVELLRHWLIVIGIMRYVASLRNRFLAFQWETGPENQHGQHGMKQAHVVNLPGKRSPSQLLVADDRVS